MNSISNSHAEATPSLVEWYELDEDLSTKDGLGLLGLYEVNVSQGQQSFFESLGFMLQRHEETTGRPLRLEDGDIAPITSAGLSALASRTIREHLDLPRQKCLTEQTHEQLAQMTIAKILDIDIELVSGANHASLNEPSTDPQRDKSRTCFVIVMKPGGTPDTNRFCATQKIALVPKVGNGHAFCRTECMSSPISPGSSAPVLSKKPFSLPPRPIHSTSAPAGLSSYDREVEAWRQSDAYKDRIRRRHEPGNWVLHDEWLMQPRI